MKLTKSQLKQIIKEELQKALSEVEYKIPALPSNLQKTFTSDIASLNFKGQVYSAQDMKKDILDQARAAKPESGGAGLYNYNAGSIIAVADKNGVPSVYEWNVGNRENVGQTVEDVESILQQAGFTRNSSLFVPDRN
jgi:hypothetical protein